MVVVFCPQLVAKRGLNEVSLTLWYPALVHCEVKADCFAFFGEDGFGGQNDLQYFMLVAFLEGHCTAEMRRLFTTFRNT